MDEFGFCHHLPHATHGRPGVVVSLRLAPPPPPLLPRDFVFLWSSKSSSRRDESRRGIHRVLRTTTTPSSSVVVKVFCIMRRRKSHVPRVGGQRRVRLEDESRVHGKELLLRCALTFFERQHDGRDVLTRVFFSFLVLVLVLFFFERTNERKTQRVTRNVHYCYSRKKTTGLLGRRREKKKRLEI